MQNPYDPADRGIPSIKSLIAFEAVVRLGSMTAAARELNATQPAVSQHIRQIEDKMGVSLFDRSNGKVILTPISKRFYEEVVVALKMLESAAHECRNTSLSGKRKITIAAYFGFVHLWLLPRLNDFEKDFPNYHFEIIPVDRDDTQEMEQADLSIRFGPIRSTEKTEHLLAHERVFPICSPAFAQQYSLKDKITEADLSDLPLLHMDVANTRWLDWRGWAKLADFRLKIANPKIFYNNYPLLLNAVKDGKGIALGWSSLLSKSINEGSIVTLGPIVERKDFGYICSSRFSDNAAIAPIIDWLLQRMRS